MNLTILTGIFPPDVGGPATYVPRFADACQQRGHSVRVVTLNPTQENTNSVEFNYPVHRWSRSRGSRIWASQTDLPGILAEGDCAYVNGLELEYLLSQWRHGCPSVQKIVGDRSWERYRNQGMGTESIDEFQDASLPLKQTLNRAIQRYATRIHNRVIVPSRYLQNIVAQWGVPTENIDVIYNSVHTPENIPEEKINWPGDSLKILNVGRVVPWKRVPGVIDCLSALDEAGLVILGDGPELDRCRSLARTKNLQDQVRFQGNVAKREVFQHLEQCDVLVLNSTYEGFPHILLEAVATGTPVIAAASGGTRELAEFFPDQIRTYPVNEQQQLAELLRHRDFPDSYDPPEFPESLQWSTIVNQTLRTLEDVRVTNG